MDDVSTNETLTRGDTLGEQIYRWLANAITAGSYAPQERINIRRLADELRASVTPVREAVLRLVADGVLATTEKSAIIVPERTLDEIEEIFQVRRALEGEMALAAAPHITPEDVGVLKTVHARFLEALDQSDYPEALRLNAIFHFTIYKRSSLPLRLKITESLWLRIGPTLRYMYPFLQQERQNHRRHENIIEAASRGNSDELRSAILADLESSQTALRNYLEEHPQTPKRRRRKPD